MVVTDIYIDRVVADPDLAKAFAHAFDVAGTHVAVAEDDDLVAVARAWNNRTTEVLLRTSRMRGEFPEVIDLMVRGQMPRTFQRVLARAATRLRAAILTDEIVVDPFADSEWLLIAPDGTSTVVLSDAEKFASDDPAIILTAESRRVLERYRVAAPAAS
jgi:hypothetical protein